MTKRILATIFAVLVLTLAVPLVADDKPEVVKTRSGVRMTKLPGGEFTMGRANGGADEKPERKVTVDGFYIDVTPVTQKHYRKLMGNNPSRWKGKDKPVDSVRWSDAVRYCNKRSEMENLEPCYDLETWECDFDASGYRLPTEAEWEYACRAGTQTAYFFGDDAAKLKLYAVYKANSENQSRPVAGKLPNPWGLYDMSGNVLEWCHDIYDADYYKNGPAKNPRGPEKGDTRVLRGGSWESPADQCTSSYRSKDDPGYLNPCFGYDMYGFRCVRKAGE